MALCARSLSQRTIIHPSAGCEALCHRFSKIARTRGLGEHALGSSGFAVCYLQRAMLPVVPANRLPTEPRVSSGRIPVSVRTPTISARSSFAAARYPITFANLIGFVERQLPSSEVIHEALRKKWHFIPVLPLREIIANALMHQDFTISGAGPLIEIFYDRIEISHPGRLLPSNTLDRIIGTQPESRNEKLAKAFRMYGICEQLGSGLIRRALQLSCTVCRRSSLSKRRTTSRYCFCATILCANDELQAAKCLLPAYGPALSLRQHDDE